LWAKARHNFQDVFNPIRHWRMGLLKSYKEMGFSPQLKRQLWK